jgi:hypothetical protein
MVYRGMGLLVAWRQLSFGTYHIRARIRGVFHRLHYCSMAHSAGKDMHVAPVERGGVNLSLRVLYAIWGPGTRRSG